MDLLFSCPLSSRYQLKEMNMTTSTIVMIVGVALAALLLIAALAEADIKTAQAKGLQQQAAGHRSEAATSRDQVNEQLERADELDPATPTTDDRSATHVEPQPTVGPR